MRQLSVQSVVVMPTEKRHYPDEERAFNPNASKLSRGIDAILCFVLGGIGAHCFYEGKTGKGIAYIFTFGLLGIGCLVDLIKILAGNQKDKEGKPILIWDLD